MNVTKVEALGNEKVDKLILKDARHGEMYRMLEGTWKDAIITIDNGENDGLVAFVLYDEHDIGDSGTILYGDCSVFNNLCVIYEGPLTLTFSSDE